MSYQPKTGERCAVLRERIEAMRPRWKAEVDACIAKHGLKVYGDEWKRAG